MCAPATRLATRFQAQTRATVSAVLGASRHLTSVVTAGKNGVLGTGAHTTTVAVPLSGWALRAPTTCPAAAPTVCVVEDLLGALEKDLIPVHYSRAFWVLRPWAPKTDLPKLISVGRFVIKTASLERALLIGGAVSGVFVGGLVIFFMGLGVCALFMEWKAVNIDGAERPLEPFRGPERDRLQWECRRDGLVVLAFMALPFVVNAIFAPVAPEIGDWAGAGVV